MENSTDKNTLGAKIRFFRKRAGMSQMDLEMGINGAAGMLSRIESGQVNPSKETVLEVSKALKLNKREIDCMVGASSNPVTPEEIENARDEIKDYFSRANVFAYLICDRQRIWEVSKGFYRLFSSGVENPDRVSEKVRSGTQIIGVMIDPQYGISSYFDKDNLEIMLNYNLTRYYKELNFITDDTNIQETIRLIEEHPVANMIWRKIIESDGLCVRGLDSKIITFNFQKVKVSLRYGRENLNSNPRFEVIEYVPTSRLLKLIAGFG